MKIELSRRQFLGATGVFLGLTTVGVAETLASPFENNSLGQIGLILPTSGIYPQLAQDFNAGLQKNLGKYAINHLSARESLQAFAQRHDILLTYASPSSAALLRKQLADSPARIVAADFGMDVQRFAEKLPRLDYLSLNFWQASQALALWTRENLGERIAIVADSYETGYDSFTVFQAAFPSAELILFDKNTDLSHLGNLDAVAFALHGNRAGAFLRSYERSGNSAPLVRLPYIGDRIASSLPIYSAEFALSASPFLALGELLAANLTGQNYNQDEILIKRDSQVLLSLSRESLPYHGLSSALKTGWTNSYLC